MVYDCSTIGAAEIWKSLVDFSRRNDTTEVTLAMALVKRWWTKSEREGYDGGRETGRACNINPFNKLIIDEIYRAFTVRGGGANALHLSRGNPGYISGLAPLWLDLRARANEPRPASAMKEVQDDAAALGRYGYDAARGSWASLKIYPAEWRRRKSKEEWSWRDRQWLKYCSTSRGAIKRRTILWKKFVLSKIFRINCDSEK